MGRPRRYSLANIARMSPNLKQAIFEKNLNVQLKTNAHYAIAHHCHFSSFLLL
jgi:hypothetical protein